MADPRNHTPRDPDWPTDGHLARFAGHLFGRTVLPWISDAVDVIGEHDPETGRYRYPVALILVPRQCAKTTTALDIGIGRGIATPDYRVAYTAQTGHATTERLTERFAAIAGAGLQRRLSCRRSAGTERITDRKTGSYVKAFPPISGSLRGSALDLVLVDEAQEHDTQRGIDLDQSILPTFSTRPRRQLILLATAGGADSGYLERYLDAAKDPSNGIALIDYGATEDDDPLDPAVWRRVHPGLAGGLTDEDYLASVAALDLDTFRREYLNVATVAGDGDRPLAPAAWIQAADPAQTLPDPGRATLAVDVSADRQFASIGAAWADGAIIRVGLLWHGPPADLDTRLLQLVDLWKPAGPVLHDPVTAAASLVPSTVLQAVPFTDYSAGCALLMDRLTAGALRHRPDPDLTAAALNVRVRPAGDGGRAWGRRRSGHVDISPLVAVTLASTRAASERNALFI